MSADDNVVQRLKQRLAQARREGFKVRLEVLDGEQATWCEIAGVPTLFVDLSQTAAEQLRQLEETLSAYSDRGPDWQEPLIDAAPRLRTDGDLAKRAA